MTEMSQGTRSDRRALLATCVAAAVKAGEVIRAGTKGRDSLTWESKGAFDFVSDVDRASEDAIVSIVHERHPDATMLAEEGSPTADASRGLVFCADPLDGTTNFLHGMPWYAVSIAALVDGEVSAGVVLNVPSGALFTATLGGGARLSGQEIHVSSESDPGRALIGTGLPFSRNDEIDQYMPLLPPIMRATAGIRRFGVASLDLASVAAGRFDAFFELRLFPWDLAAGVLLIREAGGICTTMTGDVVPLAPTSLCCGGAAMHAWLLQSILNAQRQSAIHQP